MTPPVTPSVTQLGQIKKVKIDRTLFKLAEGVLAAKKSDVTETAKAEAEGRTPEDEDWISLQVCNGCVTGMQRDWISLQVSPL